MNITIGMGRGPSRRVDSEAYLGSTLDDVDNILASSHFFLPDWFFVRSPAHGKAVLP